MTSKAPGIAQTHDAARTAAESGRRLAERLRSRQDLAAVLHLGGPGGESLAIPPAVLPILADVLNRMGDGDPPSELDEQEAADLLGVPREYLLALVTEGSLSHRAVGGTSRLALRDILDFKRRSDADRVAAMAELAAQAQELGLGY